MGANGNINDLELQKFMDLAGEMGIRVHVLHGDNWLPSVANLAALPGSGNILGDVRQALDTGIPYRWNGSAWSVWISAAGVTWGSITGTLASQTDLQTALNAKMGSGAYVLTSRDSALTNQVNLGALTTGILKQTVAAGVSTFTIVTDNSGNWNTAYTHSQIVTGNPHGTTKADISLGNVDNTSDVNKPVSTAQAAADTAALNAAKAYADGLVVGLLDDRGNFNASANTWPSSGGSGTAGAILKGDLWTISVAGTLGGTAVTVGDVIRAIVDTPGTTASNWAISENNFGYTAENSANKDASGGYVGLTLFKLNMRNAANSITSWFTNTNTAARTYTLPDKDGTVAMTSDITGTNSGTNTGDETAARIGALINGSTDQPTPADTDLFALGISSVLRKLTYANLKASLKTYFDTIYAKYLGDADFYKYKITTSIASGNITVTVLNYLGATPSATTPIKIQNADGTIRTITSSCTATIAFNDYYHFDAGSADLATKEIDYCIYLSIFGGPAISRRFHYRLLSDATGGGEYCISNTGGFSGTETIVPIGRFNAIKASGTSGNWSIPATSNIINNPVNETRWLDCESTFTANGSMTITSVTKLGAKYKIVGTSCFMNSKHSMTTGGTASNEIYNTLPVGINPVNDNGIIGNGIYYNGTEYATAIRMNRWDLNKAANIKYDKSNFTLSATQEINTCVTYQI